jgi:hypothetical protein
MLFELDLTKNELTSLIESIAESEGVDFIIKVVGKDTILDEIPLDYIRGYLDDNS